MKPIFIPRVVSTGKTFATGITEMHQSPLHSAMVNSVVRCDIFHLHRGPYFFVSTGNVTVARGAERYRHMLGNL
jgi:hypothetical protein